MSNQLIKCKACGNDLAVTADQCPKCGGLNEYIHPQIERFLQEGSSSINVPCQYKYDRFSMLFYVRDRSPLWQVQWHLKGYVITWIINLIMKFMPWEFILGYGFGSLVGVLLEISLYAMTFVLIYGYIKWIFSLRLLNADTGILGPQKTYFISFKEKSPEVNTNDTEYWKEVDAFFKNNIEKPESIAS